MLITEFLEARIAEDEATLAEVPAAAKQSDDFDFGGTDDYLRFTMGYGRAVAECAAKRAVIADHAEFVDAIEYLSAALPGDLNKDPAATWRTSAFRRLAAVYADHPDYQQEWALDVG